tara:strand:- start:150 stop:368 length:219 start_codon:yes stop_codon:yes gene_type:complete
MVDGDEDELCECEGARDGDSTSEELEETQNNNRELRFAAPLLVEEGVVETEAVDKAGDDNVEEVEITTLGEL